MNWSHFQRPVPPSTQIRPTPAPIYSPNKTESSFVEKEETVPLPQPDQYENISTFLHFAFKDPAMKVIVLSILSRQGRDRAFANHDNTAPTLKIPAKTSCLGAEADVEKMDAQSILIVTVEDVSENTLELETAEITPIEFTVTDLSLTKLVPVESSMDADPLMAEPEIVSVDSIITVDPSTMPEIAPVDSMVESASLATEPELISVDSATGAEPSTSEIIPVEYNVAVESRPCESPLIEVEGHVPSESPVTNPLFDTPPAQEPELPETILDDDIELYPPVRPASPSLAEKKQLKKLAKAKGALNADKAASEKPKKSRVAMSKKDVERLAAKKARQAARKTELVIESDLKKIN